MTSETWDISRLRNWDKNPRGIKKADMDRLKRQLSKHDQFKPVLVTPDGEVLGGNMRLKAMQLLGVKEVWVSVVEPKDDAEKVAIALADNDRAGYWEEDALAELLSSVPDLDLEDYHLDLGKTLSAKDLLDKYRPTEEDDFDVEGALPEEGGEVTKLGDVYRMGSHRLMCGDATDRAAADMLVQGRKPDMLFTDPPYGMDYSGRGKETSDGIMGDKGDPSAMYAVGQDVPERYLWGRAENWDHLPSEPRDTIIWKKNSFGMGSGYRGQYECCFYWGNFRGSDSDVWEVPKDTKYCHPTQKPIALAARACKNSTKEGDVVLDLFGGSGSTLVACEQVGRRCLMMELDPRYCDVIVKRWEAYTGQTAVKIEKE